MAAKRTLTIDEVIRRLACRMGVTLAAAAELLREDPELVDSIAADPDPPGIEGPFSIEDAARRKAES